MIIKDSNNKRTKKIINVEKKILTTEGFEPSPFRNSALNYRLRPLGQIVIAKYL